MSGLWVVFEDIDKSPLDVHSIILPLLEGARSFVTGHGEVTTAYIVYFHFHYYVHVLNFD